MPAKPYELTESLPPVDSATRAIRSKSLARLERAGLAVPAMLPLLDEFSARPVEEIVDRIVCLNAVAAAAHGFDNKQATAWLSQEGMLENLTEDERTFLSSGVGDVYGFKVQVEAMWALAWLVGIVPNLDFWRGCSPRFVTMVPDLKAAESSSNFRARARLRNELEIGAKVDLAYCLHWTLRQSEIKRDQPPRGIVPYVVVERRRALEWAVGDEAWDSVSLDT